MTSEKTKQAKKMFENKTEVSSNKSQCEESKKPERISIFERVKRKTIDID